MRRWPLALLVGLVATTVAFGAGHAPYSRADVANPVASADAAWVPLVLSQGDRLNIAVVADMRQFAGPGRYDSPRYFRGAVEAIAARGDVDVVISPGDIDPVEGVYWTLTSTLGSGVVWYPVAGNHELPGNGREAARGANMRWLNAHDYGGVIPGPTGCVTTTYAVDIENVHLVMLNEYCDEAGDTATHGDVPDHLYEWLAADLATTDQEHIIVFGHEPAYPQPDRATGRSRHVGDSLDQHPATRDRFWALLREHGVLAYVCGHTHNYSALFIDGVWQIDVGHARGVADAGAPSTYVLLHIARDDVSFGAYRSFAGAAYALAETEGLAGSAASQKGAPIHAIGRAQ